MRTSTILFGLFFMFVGSVLYRVKYEVDHLALEHKTISQNIHKTQESIHVLNAEWAHLNNPARIRQLAQKYLPTQNHFPLKNVGQRIDQTNNDSSTKIPENITNNDPISIIEPAETEDAFCDLLSDITLKKGSIRDISYQKKSGG